MGNCARNIWTRPRRLCLTMTSTKPQMRFGRAAASALKAVCQERGWNHRFHNHLRAAAVYLALEWNRPGPWTWSSAISIICKTLVASISGMWAKCSGGWMWQNPTAGKSCGCGGPNRLSQEHLTPEIIRELNSFRRTLACPLPDRVAFGAELQRPGTGTPCLRSKPPHI